MYDEIHNEADTNYESVTRLNLHDDSGLPSFEGGPLNASGLHAWIWRYSYDRRLVSSVVERWN